jgi:hypothetical protein
MAAVFTLGVSALGATGQGNLSNIGTFLAGVLLVALAAFTPMLTFSFIHWAGDQSYVAVHTMQQGSKGTEAARDHAQGVRQWRADHFSANKDTGSDVVGETETARNGDSPADADSSTNEVAHTASDITSDERSNEAGDGLPGAAPVAIATATATANGVRSEGDGSASEEEQPESRSGRPAQPPRSEE